jgi:hypothetical protein
LSRERRGVDDECQVLDVLVQKRRNKAAALKLLRKLLKDQGIHPETITTDKLASYSAAAKVLGLSNRHRPARKQSRRKFAFGDPTTRAKTAEIQVAGLSPKISFRPLRHLQRLQPTPPPDPPIDAAPVSERSSSGLGGRNCRRVIKER